MLSVTFSASSGAGRGIDAGSMLFDAVEHAEVWKDIAIPSSLAERSPSSPT